jgi:serine/threonine protein kinase
MAAVPAGLATALQDRYRLDRELGHGGMATVYPAQDLKHDRDVALQTLAPADSGRQQAIQARRSTCGSRSCSRLPVLLR